MVNLTFSYFSFFSGKDLGLSGDDWFEIRGLFSSRMNALTVSFTNHFFDFVVESMSPRSPPILWGLKCSFHMRKTMGGILRADLTFYGQMSFLFTSWCHLLHRIYMIPEILEGNMPLTHKYRTFDHLGWKDSVILTIADPESKCNLFQEENWELQVGKKSWGRKKIL